MRNQRSLKTYQAGVHYFVSRTFLAFNAFPNFGFRRYYFSESVFNCRTWL